jgi:uncharacterized protein (TIGR02594 family)
MLHVLHKASEYIGTAEVPGPEANPTIVGWIKRFAKNLKSKLALNSDETAWCAVFVSMVLTECGYRGTDHALASSYIKWGKPSKIEPGIVIVLKRIKDGSDPRTGSRAGYHVGILHSFGKHYIGLVGGNQSNEVRLSWFPRSKYQVVAMRRPTER